MLQLPLYDLLCATSKAQNYFPRIYLNYSRSFHHLFPFSHLLFLLKITKYIKANKHKCAVAYMVIKRTLK